MDFDTILQDVGEFGRYQKLLIPLVILPACLPGGMHGFSQIFTVAIPEHYHCRIPNAEHLNLTHDRINALLPWDATLDAPSQCEMYDANYSALHADFDPAALRHYNRTKCKYGWWYDRTVFTSTVATQWNLVCDDDIKSMLSLEYHTMGTLFGSLVFGYLADQIGRKRTYCIAIVQQLATGLLTAAAPEYVSFCIIRFLNGCTIVPSWILPLIMGLELVGPDHRAPIGISMSVFYTLGSILLGAIAYGIRDWFYLQFAVSCPFLIFISFFWILPESPRWLISQGRLKDTIKIVRKVANVNGIQLSEQYYTNLRQMFRFSLASGRIVIRRYYVMDLFRTPNLRRKTCLVVFSSFVNYAVYNGLNFFSETLGGEPQFNFLLCAVVELPSYLVLYATLNRFGRKPILCGTMILSGLLCIIKASIDNTHTAASTGLFLLAKFFITCSYFVSDLMASELFPTVVRGAGASLTQTVAAIGLCSGPIITYFAKSFEHLPLFIFGSLAILGGVAATILPETKDQLLPDSLEEGELFGRYSTWIDRVCGCRKSRRIGTASGGSMSVTDEDETAWYAKENEDDDRKMYAKEESTSDLNFDRLELPQDGAKPTDLRPKAAEQDKMENMFNSDLPPAEQEKVAKPSVMIIPLDLPHIPLSSPEDNAESDVYFISENNENPFEGAEY